MSQDKLQTTQDAVERGWNLMTGTPLAEPKTTAEQFITLKTWPDQWDAVNSGRKPFEVRRNDRDYRVGVILLLQRWDPVADDFTYDATGHPMTVARRVTYVLPGGQFGVESGFVVMGVQNVQ